MFTSLWSKLTGQKTTAPPPTTATCLMCGTCCKSFGGHLHASAADLRRWQELGREDILTRVGSYGFLWIDPISHRIAQECPFLAQLDEERWGCSIHEVKPDICRAYPTLAHARRCLRGVFLETAALCCAWWELGCGEMFCLA